ncbi:MAG: glutathione peroxidase [Euryarchaeota archaeon]|nr:glutathione peroxidase [Euryarchaeota archaeon]|tara:strand:- start:67 stop:522 length:456 start_codon:yes stop_codon:yes gene_type:complete
MGNPLDIEVDMMNGEKTTLRSLGESGTENWLVVNVASACGFTRQYEQLQEKSTQDGITVVGFPCNQFGGQEPGSHQEICDFTSSKYNVDFPLMAKLEVKGENQHPLFTELSQSVGSDGHTGDIRWNFEKFVISKDGSVARFTSKDSPLDIV